MSVSPAEQARGRGVGAELELRTGVTVTDGVIIDEYINEGPDADAVVLRIATLVAFAARRVGTEELRPEDCADAVRLIQAAEFYGECVCQAVACCMPDAALPITAAHLRFAQAAMTVLPTHDGCVARHPDAKCMATLCTLARQCADARGQSCAGCGMPVTFCGGRCGPGRRSAGSPSPAK